MEGVREESNVERKQKGESLSGGESSAEYIISESEGESQLSDNTKKISPTSDTKNPTTKSENLDRKERGDSLPGGESSAEYMASRAGKEEPGRKSEVGKVTEGIGDKITAGAKALKKKAEDPDRSLKAEYDREKST